MSLGAPCATMRPPLHAHKVGRIAKRQVQVVQHGDNRPPTTLQASRETQHLKLMIQIQIRCRSSNKTMSVDCASTIAIHTR